jgi:putative nucleotidyltransferase with HDIG domain
MCSSSSRVSLFIPPIPAKLSHNASGCGILKPLMSRWSDIIHATNAQILTWAEAQPWARAMAACQQDAQWHAEGDVWTHTRMVCAELERLADWPSLDRPTQLKLLFSALFHDAGKPATTVPEPDTGRIRSPRHALAGAEIARRMLRELECGLVTREEIAALVRFHGRPPFLLEKANPEHEVISLSWQVNNRLLYLFALADTRGRQAKEMARPEENLDLWKLVAEEHGCFDKPYPFVNDHARFLFYRDQLSSLHYTPHEDYRCTVMLMSGLPGAGKDTWLARHRPGVAVVSLDAIRSELDVDATDNQGAVIQSAREQCREHLRARRDFAFNATNITRQMRGRWIELFADYNARIEIVYLEPPLRTILMHNQRRTNTVPEKVIEQLLERLEPPTITECHALTIAELATP